MARLGGRLRPINLVSVFFFVLLLALGVLSAYWLIMHLLTGAVYTIEPGEIGRDLGIAGVKLIVYTGVLVVLLAVFRWAHRTRNAFWQTGRFFTLGAITLLLEGVLSQVCKLIVPLSFSIAWHIETAALILAIAAPMLLVWALLHGETWWLKKQP